jgi:hypothetical protein
VIAARPLPERSAEAPEPTLNLALARVIAPGLNQSRVHFESDPEGQEVEVPHALILALPVASVRPGELVLALDGWALGRMRVVGGTPGSPTVDCMDVDPAFACAGRQLDSGTFLPLTAEGQTGTSLACAEGEERLHALLLREVGDQVLAQGFAGRLLQRPSSSCERLPLQPQVEPGQTVQVPVVGRYVRAEALSAEGPRWRVRVEWAGRQEEVQAAGHDLWTAPPVEGAGLMSRSGPESRSP